MDTKKFLMGTIGGAIGGLIAGFLIYGMALSGYMADNSMEGLGVETPDWLWLIIANLVYGALLSYIYIKWASISTLMGGLKAGLLVGLGISLGSACLWYAVSNAYTGGVMPMIVDGIAGAVVWAVAGGVCGMAIGMGGKE